MLGPVAGAEGRRDCQLLLLSFVDGKLKPRTVLEMERDLLLRSDCVLVKNVSSKTQLLGFNTLAIS